MCGSHRLPPVLKAAVIILPATSNNVNNGHAIVQSHQFEGLNLILGAWIGNLTRSEGLLQSTGGGSTHQYMLLMCKPFIGQ